MSVRAGVATALPSAATDRPEPASGDARAVGADLLNHRRREARAPMAEGPHGACRAVVSRAILTRSLDAWSP